jgi:hypothetical protein
MSITMKNLTEEYVNIDWMGICSNFDLEHGDISPEQSFEIDRALGNINEVIHAFIDQNKTKTMKTTAIPALTLTNTEYNVLAVALDHMYEHLNDLVGDFDTFEEENINLKRIVDVQSLKEMFNL